SPPAAFHPLPLHDALPISISAVCFSLPGSVPVTALLVGLPLYLVLAAALVAIGLSRAIWWPILALAAGVGIIVSVGLLAAPTTRSEEHTSELQSRENLVCR